MSAYYNQVFSTIRTLKSLACESYNYRKAVEQVHRALLLALKANWVGACVGAFNRSVRAGGVILVMWFGWVQILEGQLSLGGYIAFTMYHSYLTGPLSRVTSLFVGFQQTAVSFARMFEYLDQRPEQNPATASMSRVSIVHRLSGHCSTERLCFGYVAAHPVLQEITLDIEAGSVLAIVGRSGAGKSSLLRLLCRIEEPTSGLILYDGRPTSEIPLCDLRRQISFVWQEQPLFRGTLWENLALDNDSVSMADIEEIVHICHLEEIVGDLPEGLEAPVAEWGASLSGGQQQLLAIARALLRRTPILLLDEATSNIDLPTERELLGELLSRTTPQTVILTTHRPGTAALADRILVLDGGRVAGLGGHADLMSTCREYQQIHGYTVAKELEERSWQAHM